MKVGKFCLETQEPLYRDLGSIIRLHLCWCSVKHRFWDSGQPTCSRTELFRLFSGHISNTERYILEIPFPLIINSPKNITIKFTKKHLQNDLKHSIWHWSYHLFIIYLEYCFHMMNALLWNCDYQMVMNF